MELEKVRYTKKLVDPDAEELNEFLANGWQLLLTYAQAEPLEGGALYTHQGIFFLGWSADAAPWYPAPVQTEEVWL